MLNLAFNMLYVTRTVLCPQRSLIYYSAKKK